MSVLMDDKRTRMIIDTTDDIRMAVRAESLQLSIERGEDVTYSDVVNEILREALKSRIDQVRRDRDAAKGKPKPGKKRED